MIKKSSRIKYGYRGEHLNIKEIYSRNKKRRGRSKYLLSADIMLGKEDPATNAKTATVLAIMRFVAVLRLFNCQR